MMDSSREQFEQQKLLSGQEETYIYDEALQQHPYFSLYVPILPAYTSPVVSLLSTPPPTTNDDDRTNTLPSAKRQKTNSTIVASVNSYSSTTATTISSDSSDSLRAAEDVTPHEVASAPDMLASLVQKNHEKISEKHTWKTAEASPPSITSAPDLTLPSRTLKCSSGTGDENSPQNISSNNSSSSDCEEPSLYDDFFTQTMEAADETKTGKKKKTKRKKYRTNKRVEHWEKMYQTLVTFKKNYGHTTVPHCFEHGKLEAWVGTQRNAYKDRRLEQKYYDLLNDIGLKWNVKQKAWLDIMTSASSVRIWEQMFERLIMHKLDNNGSTVVPEIYEKDPKLGLWVAEQRERYGGPTMTKERERRLDAIGFVWSTTSKPVESWGEMIQRLALYKSKHDNDTNVPKYYEADIQLGVWVQTQRIAKKRNKLSQERITLLNLCGFAWSRKPVV